MLTDELTKPISEIEAAQLLIACRHGSLTDDGVSLLRRALFQNGLALDHSSDDDTPLDEEFLHGLGWEEKDWAYVYLMKARSMWLVWHTDAVLAIYQGRYSIEWPVKIRTRGQLRDLLAVLGEPR